MDEVDDGEVAILIDGKDWFICKAIIFTGKGLVSDSLHVLLARFIPRDLIIHHRQVVNHPPRGYLESGFRPFPYVVYLLNAQYTMISLTNFSNIAHKY
ncbi:hypothetical protein DYE50_11870 [Treponema ruminis]|uniref:hypothetical protein n=1 Tax=Treponema ruminis TaxID=744515 RepID=UPI00197E8BD9|nr:hypothetical protein [Treponema ruminis]QSI03263.1 hypothetical protein DYE50_11870 [Treponema ruminis]